MAVEKQIINRILKTRDISWLRGKPYYDNYDLWKVDREYYEIIKEHYDKYGEVPSVVSFLEQCGLHKLPDFEYSDVTDSVEYLLNTMDDDTTYSIMAPKINGLNPYFSGDQRVLYDKFREVTKCVGDYIDSLGVNKQYGTDLAEYDPFAPDDESNYMPIGFSEIDDYTKGLDSDGELVGIIAKTNQGKTWILLQMAYAAYSAGKNVLIINTEMSKKQVMQRIVTLATHVSNTEIKECRVSKEDIEKYKNIVKSHENRLTVVDLAELNPTVSTIEMLISNYRCDAVYIDGISYVRPNVDKEEKSYQTLQNVSLALSEVAMKTKTPIVVTVQANRDKGATDTLPPSMDDISGSYAINFVCTKVFTFERFGNEIKILLAKSRTSGVGTIWTYDWDIDHGIFRHIRTGSISDTEESEQKSPCMDVRDIVNRKRNAIRNQQPLKRNDKNNIF